MDCLCLILSTPMTMEYTKEVSSPTLVQQWILVWISLPVVLVSLGKHIPLSLVKQTGYVIAVNMALIVQSASTSRLKVKICSKVGLGELLISTGR